MKRFAVVLLLGAWLSGCSGSGSHATSSPLVPEAKILQPSGTSATITGPVTVGVKGNEPIVTQAPDGTLYIAALANIYRSLDKGATWTAVPNPTLGTTVLASDSSISVDSGNRLYYTFDYPYAGNTAVCTSDDRGNTWNCNPAVAPGGTDRMWILAASTGVAYETTNEGLYQTTFLLSNDRGQTWTPQQFANGVTQPQTGPLATVNAGSYVLQPLNENGYLYVYRFFPVQTLNPVSDVQPTGVPQGVALPTGVFGRDATYYVAGEQRNPAGGREIMIGRSSNQGAAFSLLPPVPQTTTGTAVFTAVAAGGPGHIGVIYYHTASNGDPTTMSATWDALYAETYNATSATPTWKVTTLDAGIHTGSICSALSCSGTSRFSGDFISAFIDGGDNANLTWIKESSGGTTSVRFERIPPHILK